MTKYQYAIPIEHKLEPGPLWPYKHNKEEIEILKKSDPFVASGQYFQDPSAQGGAIFKTDAWQFFSQLPYLDYKIITADTGQKAKEVNDFSVLQCWGKAYNGIYLIDQARGKWEAPELLRQTRSFFLKHKITQGGCRGVYVEDKVSGTGLIQTLKNASDMGQDKLFIPVYPIQRNIDKVTRSYDVVGYIISGYVYLPEEADFLYDYIEEFRKFSPMMTHKHDDQIDPTIDAINIMLIQGTENTSDVVVAPGIGSIEEEF